MSCIAVAPSHLCSNMTDVLMWMGKCLQNNCLIHLTLVDLQFGVRFPTDAANPAVRRGHTVILKISARLLIHFQSICTE